MTRIDRFGSRVAWFIGTGFGLGLMPKAPGTWGSLLGPPLVYLLQRALYTPTLYWAVSLCLILLAGPICGRAARFFGEKDPGPVVLDEIVSFVLVFAAVRVTWTTAVLGFLWFRIFDISKPWPAHRLEALPGGWGVLADDLAAGVYAGLALWGTMWVWGSFAVGLFPTASL